MTKCAYEGCTQDAVASVLWTTGSMRNYCGEHTRQTRDEYPELITEVDQL